MALPQTRRSFLFEEPMMGDFNLGMGADAFANLGMPNLAAVQNEGLLSLPGANNVVANPIVAQNLMDQAVAKTAVPTIPGNEQPGARAVVDSDFSVFDNSQQNAATTNTATTNTATTTPTGLSLEDVYQQVLGRAPDTGGLEHWTKEFGETVDPTELARFTAEAAPELKAKDLFEKYVTGFDADQTAIDFWRQKLAAPGATEEDVLNQFLNPTDKNAPRMFLMQADPDYIAAMKAAQPAVDTTNFPKFEGTAYNPTAYDNIVKQLTAQQQAIEKQSGFKYDSTFGGAQETIADMAKRLAASGISDIRDFGQRYSVVAEKVYDTIPGDEGGYQTIDTGKYRTVTGIEGYDSEGEPIYKYRELTPSEMKRLKFDNEGMAFLDATKDDIEKNPFAESVYYNKKTGEIIDKRKIGGKAESGIWGSSGSGDGYTNYRVQYTKEGVPVFYPEKNLSGMKEFIAEDLSGILSVLRFIPGAQIPVMLAQAAAAAHMGAKPGDILKNMATSYISSNIGNFLTKGIPGTDFKGLPSLGVDLPTSDFGKLLMSGGVGALQSLIQGSDLETALKSGVLSAAGTGIRGLLPTIPEGELDYGKILTALAPAIADGKLSNADVFRLIQAAVPPTNKKTPGKP